MNKLKRINIAGVGVDIASAQNAAAWTLERFEAGIQTAVAPVNAATISMASRNPEFKQGLNQFDLLLADGFWPALAGTLLARCPVPHANTSPFIRSFFEQTVRRKIEVYLLGATLEIVQSVAKEFHRIHPKGNVVGYEHGYFEANDEFRIIEKINKSGAAVLLIGIGSPKRESFIGKHLSELRPGVIVSVGGLFDVWGGKVKEAPAPIRHLGFEWLFRLVQEPRRLWKRYSVDNLCFLSLVLRQMCRGLSRKS
jgi:N-acetylglucosaminyldiphosphoundecaprenol N-acetyl-beta-D-mannosaminyltransferase